jgi:hypothetical protein
VAGGGTALDLCYDRFGDPTGRCLMFLDQRSERIRMLLLNYVSSPSLRHIRDRHSIEKLAIQIVREVDEAGSVWKKWNPRREEVLADAIECWIPAADLLAFLNSLPGEPLTATDFEQRLRAMIEKECIGEPDEGLREECLTIYAREKAAGTEMAAIVGCLSQHVARQWPRLREERRRREQQRLDEARDARERRIRSSADCPWTQLKGSKVLYCRKNGRAFRLRPLPDKTWEMHRVREIDDRERGQLVGHYRSRGDASAVVAKAAFEEEPSWS